MEKIWGIYLNNLHFKKIEELYKEHLPSGRSKTKVDRINDLLEIDPVPESIKQNNSLFGGRVSVQWLKIPRNDRNNIDRILGLLREEPLECYERPIEPVLGGDVKIVHSFSKAEKLYMTLATGEFKNHVVISEYAIQRMNSEYFAFALLEEKEDLYLEIRSDARLVLKIINALRNSLGIQVEASSFVPEITLAKFQVFKSLLHNSRLKKYRGRSVKDDDITEIFEITAKQNIDYANEEEFQTLIEDLEDEALTLVFEFDGNEYSITLNLLTGSIYFVSFANEDVIQLVFEAYIETFWSV